MLPSKTILINSKVHAHVLKVKAKMTMAPQGDNTPTHGPSRGQYPTEPFKCVDTLRKLFLNPKPPKSTLVTHSILHHACLKPRIQKTKCMKKNPIYLSYKIIANGPNGTLRDDGDILLRFQTASLFQTSLRYNHYAAMDCYPNYTISICRPHTSNIKVTVLSLFLLTPYRVHTLWTDLRLDIAHSML